MAKLIGYEVNAEVHTDKGRIDAVLKKDDGVIVAEIKYGDKKVKKLVEQAIGQIREKAYYEKYGKSNISLLGVGFGKGKEIGCKFEGV
jgi:hypothetical protein